MSILLKQPYFLAFKQKFLFKVILQKSHLRLVCRGVLGLHLVLSKDFGEINMD